MEKQLTGQLKKIIRGSVQTDPINRCLLATDGSIYQVVPAAVVQPKDVADVSATVQFANRHGMAIHPRGAGSGLCGSSLGRGIVLDFSRYMNRLIAVNYEDGYFECEPGCRLGEIEATLKGSGLFFPPDPSSGEYATLGGMYGTNASGAHSVKYGNVSDYILDAEITFGNGQTMLQSEIGATEPNRLPDFLQKLYRMYQNHETAIEAAYPTIRYNSTGYNLRGLAKDHRLDLRRLIAGSEGTLGIATRLKFRLIDKPTSDSLVVGFFSDIQRSTRAVQEILPLGPSGIEIMDKSLLAFARQSSKQLEEKIPPGIDNVLMVEFDSIEPEVCQQMAEKVQQLLIAGNYTDQAYIAVSEEEKAKFWAIRKAAVPTLYKIKGRKRVLALIEDAAVPTEHLVDYVEGLYKILQHHAVDFVLFGHIAKGLLHTRPLLDLKDPRDVALLKILADEVFELVYSLEGAISGEHGDGRIRSAYIRRQYADIYSLFEETKQLLDPANILNPDIITGHEPEQINNDLRYGSQYQRIPARDRQLLWTEGFEDEVEKCHGCSKCTTVTVATRMCPIYKFTRDEAASPKAKANLLRAVISGSLPERDIFAGGFQHVIDQCVNCGSCLKECPSNVNIPKMAIEARARVVQRSGPSLESQLLANVELAGRTTRKFSRMLKQLMHPKISRKLMEKVTGISAHREFIAFQPRSLFERIKSSEGTGRQKALYFSGCYAGYIRPEIGEAAVKVLRRLGMTVVTPAQHCCGLPMLSKGMVKQARQKIIANINKWGTLLDSVEYVVVTCSSCGLSLLQEWSYLFDHPAVEKIRQKMIHISDLVNVQDKRLDLKPAEMSLAYHYPCHLKLQSNPDSSVRMLSNIEGISILPLDTHCCGIAGSWGMSAANYELSAEIAQDLNDKLSNCNAVAGVTDCPTCRLQMEHFASLPIRHPIEVVSELITE